MVSLAEERNIEFTPTEESYQAMMNYRVQKGVGIEELLQKLLKFDQL